MKKCERLVLLLFVILVGVKCDFELQVHLDHYKNPSHYVADGQPCCRKAGRPALCSCSNRFTICIQPADGEFDVGSFIGRKRYACPEAWQSFVTGIVGEEGKDLDDLSFEDKPLIDPLNDVPNPIVYRSQDPWPGSFQLVFAVKNRITMFREPFVDYVDVVWEIDGDTKDFVSKELQGEEKLSIFTVSVRVLCTNSTRGTYCNETLDVLEEEEADNKIIAAQEGNDESNKEAENSNGGRGNQSLVIILSTIGSIFGILILVSLASFISYFICCRGKEKAEKSSPSEKEPFLKNTTANDSSHLRYQEGSDREAGEGGQLHSYRTVEGKHNSGMPTDAPHNRVQQRVLHQMAESARRASLQEPGTGMYSIIRKGDLVLSSSSILEGSSEGGDGDENRPVSGYSVITRESMAGYVSEELSDVEEVDEEDEEADVTGTLTRQHKVEEHENEQKEEEEEEEEEIEEDEYREDEQLLQQVPDDEELEEPKPRPRMPTPPSD